MHRLPPALPVMILCFASAAFSQELRLEDIERVAMEKNPTLLEAEANIRVAEGWAKQAGLYPNPSVGVVGEEVSGGPTIRGGEIGFFVQQDIVLGGKLRKSRRVAEQDVSRARREAEVQTLKVLNSVRMLFYSTLAAQRKVEVRGRLSGLVSEAVGISRQLRNVGQADAPDLLEIEVEEQRADVALITAKNELALLWRQLAASVGDPSLRPATLAGDLEQLPVIEDQAALDALLQDSPQVKIAETGIARAEASLARAQAEKIPNLEVRGGLRYNRELLEPGRLPVGLEGFFEVGVRIPLFNKNQGNIEAARAQLDRAHREVDRVKLSLRAQLAAAYQDFLDARDLADRYKTAMLPRAEKAYDLYLAGYRQMASSYPQALIAQRTLFQLQEDYSGLLARAWTRSIEIQGMLLEGALDEPVSNESRSSQ
ncbi:MAG: TolC family protein [Acidobacteria bacterium]|nr:TolC family protein [Acidobacteriota bacterium]